MGMYDTVRFFCPECDAAVDLQSKAGPCTLKDYSYREVPHGIAESLQGRIFTCAACRTGFTVHLYVPQDGVRMEPRRV